MRNIKTGVMATILVGFLLAVGCAMMTSNAVGEGIVLSRGCYSATDIASTSISYGFRSWYDAQHDGKGKLGLTGQDGVFRYATVVAFAGNAGPIIVTRYKRYGDGDDAYVVASDFFGPGGGFADYIACDSFNISKAANDTISLKFCW